MSAPLEMEIDNAPIDIVSNPIGMFLADLQKTPMESQTSEIQD